MRHTLSNSEHFTVLISSISNFCTFNNRIKRLKFQFGNTLTSFSRIRERMSNTEINSILILKTRSIRT
ncbi:hypothetical protein BD770DRAFT_375617 [Pilaira anomala]|nr:hypothetical protein BD770DRAFT_375617 [Pilaira anomala]